MQVISTFLGLFAAGTAAWGAQGTGTVYIPNQVDDPILHVVSLTNLDGSGHLSGDYADVTNSLIARALSAAGDFQFDPTLGGDDRIHFAETMAYFHMTAYQQYVGSLGFTVAPFPIATTVFAAESFGPLWIPIPTRYDYDTKDMWFSATVDLANSDALDGDVIVHEYVHALEHDILGGVPGQFTLLDVSLTEQAFALMEALADYLPASYFDDSQIGEAHDQMFGLGVFTRDVNNFRRWPDDFFSGAAHRTGMVWSGAMWDLRSATSAEVVDKLSFQLIPLLPDNDPGTPELNTTFADALAALLQADVDLYAGAHQEQIRQAFAVHGIGQYDFSTALPMVRDPGNDYDGLEVYTDAGAAELLVTFDEFVTKLDDSPYTTNESPQPGVEEKGTVDQLTILDATDAVIGTFTGRELQGATIVVPGDTVKLHLVTDSFLPPFGYRVLEIAVPPACNDPVFDVDGDGTVGGGDFGVFATCFSGALPYPPGCECMDVDGDGIVAGEDFGVFGKCFNGALPTDPTCDDPP